MKGKRRAALVALAAACMVVAGVGATTSTVARSATTRSTTHASSSGCQLANGITHVIDIVFDNVHVNRDNPNVLSDIEQIPSLYKFMTQNGTLLTNNHTPLIGHTANDLMTNFTGLYGDRQGMGVSNDYYAFTPSGGVTPEQSVFSYWTGGGADSYPQLDYSPTVPASDPTKASPPAPWVPFTRAGCDVGGVSSVNMELENVNPDICERVRRGLARGRRRPTAIPTPQGSGDQRLRRSRRPLRAGQCVLRERRGREVRPDDAVAHRRRRTFSRTSRAATAASRRSSATSTSSRSCRRRQLRRQPRRSATATASRSSTRPGT